MIDKVVSIPRGTIARELGRCDLDEMAAVADALRLWLALK